MANAIAVYVAQQLNSLIQDIDYALSRINQLQQQINAIETVDVNNLLTQISTMINNQTGALRNEFDYIEFAIDDSYNGTISYLAGMESNILFYLDDMYNDLLFTLDPIQYAVKVEIPDQIAALESSTSGLFDGLINGFMDIIGALADGFNNLMINLVIKLGEVIAAVVNGLTHVGAFVADAVSSAIGFLNEQLFALLDPLYVLFNEAYEWTKGLLTWDDGEVSEWAVKLFNMSNTISSQLMQSSGG
jgi:hypothetical protein